MFEIGVSKNRQFGWFSKISSHIARSVAYIINELSGDFQLDGYLYKPTSGI